MGVSMKKLGLIGCGKMASALVAGVLKANVFQKEELLASDAYESARQQLADQSGIEVTAENGEVASHCPVILLCVKPNDALAALRSLAPALEGKLIVSIVAGLSIAKLQAAAGEGARVIRVMPNTPALIGKGAAAFALGEGATEGDAALVSEIFNAVGVAEEVDEKLLDAVTGVSGSGPAYGYLVIEALADGGVRAGLPRKLALQLAAQTLAGAAAMVLESGEHPAVLKDQVTSPGGTTIAALEALEEGGVRAAMMAAVVAATQRSRELGS